jgi:hypothetical protein
LEDSVAGSSGLTWELTLVVSPGTLTLSSTAGLAGSGNGTGSLSYSGTLSALNAAMDGMTYAPPAGFQGNVSLSVEAQSDIALIAGQVLITTSSFVVTTTADSGPGSLRQAILDSNTATGGSNTIVFAIPGTGDQTIALSSALPTITTSVLVDGTTQPGFAGTPLIAFGGQSPGSSDPLAVSGGTVTIRGLAIDGVTIDATADKRLIAVLQAQGPATQLSLLDSQGLVLMQSDGLSTAGPDSVIDENLAAGDYSLASGSRIGQGAFTWTTMLMPSSAPFLPIPAGGGSGGAILAGDFNGDGHLDLAVAGSDPSTGAGEVFVLLGDGDGTFQPAVTYAVVYTPNSPAAIVAGDFTGDGHLDLAVAGINFNDYIPVTNAFAAAVSVLLGNGDGTFQPAVTYAIGDNVVGYSPAAIVAGDLTGDGHLDLAVAAGSSDPVTNASSVAVSVLLGNGDGTFQPAVTSAVGDDVVGYSPAAIVSGDFTGDGHLDLAVAASSYNPDSNAYAGEVLVLLGNGDGTFQPAVQYAVRSTAYGIVADDFTGDGKLDLAVADQGVSLLVGNGDGTFQPAVEYGEGLDPNAIVAGDFNGDGRLDVAVTSQGGVSVLLGNGDGTFQPPVITYSKEGEFQTAMVAGDFNGGGRLDVAVASSDGQNGDVSILLGNGNGTFQSQVTDAVGQVPVAIVAGDFTGDGRLDLAVANVGSDDVSILLGNGDGTFQPAVQYAVGSGPQNIVDGDFNGDGRLDLAVTDSAGVQILLGNGDGSFQPVRTVAAGNGYGALVAVDFTGDGRLDLAVTNYESNDVSILLGNGDGMFQPTVTYAMGSIPTAIVAGDFTGNGRLDLAVAGYNKIANNPLSGSGTVSVLLGSGDGMFQPSVTYAVGVVPVAIVAGDFTGDGRLDLAMADRGYVSAGGKHPLGAWVLLGNGDGTFQPAVQYAVGRAPSSIVAGDFNGDGKLDLAVANYVSNDVSILLGNGDGTFQPAVQYAAGDSPEAIVAGDFNGRLDLAIANHFSNDVSVLLGLGDGTFVAPDQFAATAHATPLVADVNGDGTDDVLVVDGHGSILYRQGIPGQPGSFEPPITVNPGYPARDIAWLPETDQGHVLAGVDAHDDAISFYAYRDGVFVLVGSLTTGQLPAQVIAADLNGTGLDDLVVRNAGDGTLSVYYGTTLSDIGFVGPLGSLEPPTFLPPVTLPAGIGVSDARAVDTTGSGALDLVVTNKLTGQVSIFHNLGDRTFAAPVPYRAGTGLSAIDPGSTPEVTSLEATAGAAGGPLTPGGPTSLVTINPGSYTIDILAGLGGDRFANPVTIDTPSPAQVVRLAELTGNGIDDLAVLTAKGVSIYLGNGTGGFAPPVTYDAGVDPTGLSVADVLGNGQLDLLVGNAYGDVLILVGNGDGTFRPFEPVKGDIALAVADLKGNGALDFVFADQSLNRVTVVYGSTNQSSTSPQVIGNQATGVLAPGAVKLADLNGDGIPDLIVANSGGNDVLVYPGLGNGQFGPPVNGTAGFPVGTDPTGLAVAKLNGQPDLLVADTGSNDVSVLLGQGNGSSWTMISGPRVQTDAGPVAVAVGNLMGSTQTDLAVANSGADNVQIFPSVGSGFFNDQTKAVTTIPVGQAPSSLFLGNFNGLGQELATLNAGSNNGTLISGLNSASPVTRTFATGGDSPTSGFAGDFTGNGLTDLVVGNNGDGHLALLLGGPSGLSLSQTLVSPEAPNPTSLSFAGVSDGLLNFYVSTAGREAAMNLAFDLSGGAGSELGLTAVAAAPAGESSLSAVLNQATAGSSQQVSQLLSFTGTTLNLAATLLTVSVLPGNFEGESGGGAIATAGSTGLGQSVVGQPQGKGGPNDSGEDPSADEEGVAERSHAAAATLPPWERLSIGLEQAWEAARAAIRKLESPSPLARDQKSSARPADSPPLRPPVAVPRQRPTKAKTEAQSKPAAPSDGAAADPTAPARTTSDREQAIIGRAIDAALENLGAERAGDGPSARERWGFWDGLAASQHEGTARALVAVVATASVVGAAGTWGARSIRRARLASTSLR